MPWQLDGTFERVNPDFVGPTVWQQDQQASIKVIATRHDFHDEDLAIGIADCLNLDGLNAMREDLDMGNNKIINLQPSTGTGELATWDQLLAGGVFNNGLRELTLTRNNGANLSPIVIPAGITTAIEGPWTPQITNATMGGDNGGWFVRDGRKVDLFCVIEWVARVSSSNQVNITGLPYNIAPAYPGASLGMYATSWLTGAGMAVSGIGSGPQLLRRADGGTYNQWQPEAQISAVNVKEGSTNTLELSSYFGTNNTVVNGYGDLVNDFVMANLSNAGNLGFHFTYLTDDAI
jgi:hypothetical protein